MSRKGKGRKASKPSSVAAVQPPPAISQLLAREQLDNAYFTIVVEQQDEAQANLRVAYGPTKKGFDELLEKGVLFPYLLLVSCRVLSETGATRLSDEKRYLFPLEQGLAFLNFEGPGKHELFAAVVWLAHATNRDEAWESLHATFLRQKNNSQDYLHPLTNGRQFRFYEASAWDVYNFPVHTTVQVNVSSEFFAPEPSKQWDWWTNFCYSTKPVDECAFRRRRIGTFLYLQWLWLPVLAMLAVAIRTLVATCMFLVGYRYINWRAALRPFPIDATNLDKRGEMLEKPADTALFFHTSKKDGRRYPKWQWPLRLPIAWGIGGVYCYHLHYHFAEMLGVSLFAIGALVTITIVLFMIDSYHNRYNTPELRQRQKVAEERRAEQKVAEESAYIRQFYQTRVVPLMATPKGTPRNASLAALPKSHQTIGLRILDHKAEVCRPYRRR